MVKDRIQMESSDFNDEKNLDGDNTKETMTNTIEMHGRNTNADNRGRNNITPSRIKLPFAHMACRQVLDVLNCEPNENAREIIRDCKILAIKYDPDKW